MLYIRPFGVPRHPLARMLLAAVGVCLMLLVLVFGLFIGAVLLGFGALFWLVRQFTQGGAVAARAVPATTAGSPGVLEGEYVVLPKRDGVQH